MWCKELQIKGRHTVLLHRQVALWGSFINMNMNDNFFFVIVFHIKTMLPGKGLLPQLFLMKSCIYEQLLISHSSHVCTFFYLNDDYCCSYE